MSYVYVALLASVKDEEVGRDANQVPNDGCVLGDLRSTSPDCTSAKRVLIGPTISKIATDASMTVETIGANVSNR